MNIKRGRKGQVTIFIIVALVIVVLGLLVFLFIPNLKSTSEFDAENPELYIQNCVKEEFQSIVENLSLQGGSLNPEHYYLYLESKIEYLCYSGEYSELCTIERPFLRDHIEAEIDSELKPIVDECFESLKEKYEKKGYSVNLKKAKNIKTELLPKRILLNLPEYKMTIEKGKNVNQFNSFNAILNNNLYELVDLVKEMVEEESSNGDVNIMFYDLNYPEINFSKIYRVDGTKIYILKEKKTTTKFQFASRSFVTPPGY